MILGITGFEESKNKDYIPSTTFLSHVQECILTAPR